MNSEFFHDHPQCPELVSRYENTVEAGILASWKEEEFIQLVEFYEREKLFDRALEVTGQGIQQFPDKLEFYLRKSRLLLRCEREDMAAATLDEAERLAPNEVDIPLLRAEILIALELYEDAHTLLQSIDELDNPVTLSKVFYREALLFEKTEQYESMFYALRAALEENPANRQALEKMWLCMELSKRYEESILLHEQILDEDPYSYLAWYNLGHALAYLGRYEEAIEAYEFAFVINEKFEFAYRDCAEICFELKKYRKALRYYSEVLEHFAPDHDLLLRIGQCHQLLHHFGIAKSFFERALRLDPMNDEVFFHIGECLAQEGDFENSIKLYLKAIRIEDRREEYFASLAKTCDRLGRTDEAEQYFRQATEIAPESTEYWTQYAEFLMRQSLFEQALEVLLEAEDYSVGPELLYGQITCLFALGRRQEALLTMEVALEEDFPLHIHLFHQLPELKDDPEVLAMIAAFQPY